MRTRANLVGRMCASGSVMSSHAARTGRRSWLRRLPLVLVIPVSLAIALALPPQQAGAATAATARTGSAAAPATGSAAATARTGSAAATGQPRPRRRARRAVRQASPARPRAAIRPARRPAPAAAGSSTVSAPADVRAIGGDGSATVVWCPPASGAGSVVSYTVTSSGGQSVTAKVPERLGHRGRADRRHLLHVHRDGQHGHGRRVRPRLGRQRTGHPGQARAASRRAARPAGAGQLRASTRC